MLFRRILLPLDNSASGEASICYAKGIASAANAELHLLHVVKEPQLRCYRYEWPTNARVPISAKLPAPSRLILPGRPAQTIVDYANHIDADLIIMPTRGHGILGQLFCGSTTMDVIRNTTRPVWVLKRSLTNGEPYSCKRIVCGIELNTEGQEVLRYAARAAAAWNADLVIVHAIPGMSDAMLMLYGLDDTGEIELLPEVARRKIESMAAHIQVPFQLEVSIDDPAQYLRRAAKKHRADLVIIGRGRNTNPWSIGANIGEIIARSNSPVITYRPRTATRPTRGKGQQVTARNPYIVLPFEQPTTCEPVHSTV